MGLDLCFFDGQRQPIEICPDVQAIRRIDRLTPTIPVLIIDPRQGDGREQGAARLLGHTPQAHIAVGA